MYNQTLSSPCGMVEVFADEAGVTAVRFVSQAPSQQRPNSLTEQAAAQLKEYFAGQRTGFDVPLSIHGTQFQQQVWQQLRQVAYGTTASYGDIARNLNNPKAVRAVGLANGKNPIAIMIPCHRVIGSNGKLTGYAGGLDRKAYLLSLEGALQ